MDFFEHQDNARKKTTVLVFYFASAVILIICAVYLLAAFFLKNIEAAELEAIRGQFSGYWHPRIFAGVSLAVGLTIILASVYRTMSLSAGGSAVARILGARQVLPDTRDPDERRLVNIVEEMSVAAGISVPQVFLMERENAINAFAAGFSPDDAVIAVTAGCLKKLGRDELQSVVGHEFSHVLNGDMRLNIKLMGVLYGILVIGIIGMGIFRGALGMGLVYGPAAYHGGRSRERRGGNLPLAVFGLAVAAIGYIGVLFGHLIKSAVSRQREFFADASAVQFTRNPAGLSGALKKIGTYPTGSRINNPRAEETSHLFFSNGLDSPPFNPFATHPPLVERIKRIEPSFDGKFPEFEPLPAEKEKVPGGAPPARLEQEGGKAEMFPGADEVVSSIGTFDAGHVAFAAALIGSLPAGIKEAAHSGEDARALVYALLLSADAEARRKQMERIGEDGIVSPEKVLELEAFLEGVDAGGRLPLVEIAVPALKTMQEAAYRGFRSNVEYLVGADEKLSLFEYSLKKILFKHLDAAYGGGGKGAVRYYALKPLLPDCRVLLSLLAYFGNEAKKEASAAFGAGMAGLNPPAGLDILPREGLRFSMLDDALDKIDGALPQIKKRVISACAACVWANRKVTVREGELMRVIADALDCPLPPIVAGPGSGS